MHISYLENKRIEQIISKKYNIPIEDVVNVILKVPKSGYPSDLSYGDIQDNIQLYLIKRNSEKGDTNG